MRVSKRDGTGTRRAARELKIGRGRIDRYLVSHIVETGGTTTTTTTIATTTTSNDNDNVYDGNHIAIACVCVGLGYTCEHYDRGLVLLCTCLAYARMTIDS